MAKEYRRKNLPLDVMVVDFLNMTKQGEMDLDPKRWPDPAGMNRELHAMGIGTLLSVWPHFAAGTQFYDMLLSKGWLIHRADGNRIREATNRKSGRTSTPQTLRRPNGSGKKSATGMSSRTASTTSGWMKLSRTSTPSMTASLSVRARASTTCIRCFTQLRSTTASAAILATVAGS